jgi:DNA-directed RNA polymerase subunit RPC12/RpoP
MSMYSQARACGVEPDADCDREDEYVGFEYRCSACGATETLKRYRGSHVCPWCGEGVMQYQE